MFGSREKAYLSLIENLSMPSENNSYTKFINYFNENFLIYKCINLLANSLSYLKIENACENFQKKLNDNNFSFSSFIKEVAFNLFLSGNCFLYSQENTIKIFSTNHVQILLDKNTKKISAYEVYNVSTHKNEIHNKSCIYHIKFFNPNDIYMGLSPLNCLSRSIDTHNAISNYLLAIVYNGGKTSGILTHESYIPKDKHGRIKEELSKLYKNNVSSNNIAVLDGNYKWESIGLTPDKLLILEHKIKIEKEICAVFGIPPILVGIVDATFSNYKEARNHFWQDCILMHMNFLINHLNLWKNLNLKVQEPNEN
jgi:HK97 family phage portal protein